MFVQIAHSQVTTGPAMGTQALTDSAQAATNVLDTFGQTVANNIDMFLLVAAMYLAWEIICLIKIKMTGGDMIAHYRSVQSKYGDVYGSGPVERVGHAGGVNKYRNFGGVFKVKAEDDNF